MDAAFYDEESASLRDDYGMDAASSEQEDFSVESNSC